MVGVPICLWWTRLLRIHLLPLLVPSKRPEVLAARFGQVQFFTLPSLRDLLQQFVCEDVCGFRFFSAGRHLPLESWWWYYRLNTVWGTLFLASPPKSTSSPENPPPGAPDKLAADFPDDWLGKLAAAML